MVERSAAEFPGAARYVPPDADADALASAVQGCRGCDLYQFATQAVFSRGPTSAPVVLVGEQPGDAEDQQGKPFVGPAGRLLVRALRDAGITPGDAYVTNAVKHFKFTERGKRRIHQKPQRAEIVACRPWLVAELALTTPKVIVALGATAASALLGPRFRVTQSRGELLPWPASSDRPEDFPQPSGAHVVQVLATIHPSAVLRAPDREEAYAGLVADLTTVAVAARRRAIRSS
jgi:uracil-DNA glycosylase